MEGAGSAAVSTSVPPGIWERTPRGHGRCASQTNTPPAGTRRVINGESSPRCGPPL